MRELVWGIEGIVEAKVAENGRNKMVMEAEWPEGAE